MMVRAAKRHVEIRTDQGRYRISWDAHAAGFVAEFHPRGSARADPAPELSSGSVATVWRVEEQVGFPLPDTAHDFLAEQRDLTVMAERNGSGWTPATPPAAGAVLGFCRWRVRRMRCRGR
jgi:hypothetical protein